MKTITFSNDQVNQVRLALRTRTEFLEWLLWDFGRKGVPDSECMYVRDQIDVSRQALALVEGQS